MIPSHSSTLPERSRYVGLLSDLSEAKLNSAEFNLADRLGSLLGFSGSITLAGALRNLAKGAVGSSVDNVKTLQADVLDIREKCLKSIAYSFDGKVIEGQLTVPSNVIGTREEVLKTYEPYRRFYIAHQVEMSANIDNLRVRVRAGLAGFSPSLAQLAELDSLFEQSFEVESRNLFSTTTKLLEHRFRRLLAGHEGKANDYDDISKNWVMKGQWLDLFYQEMRELLLAEFDVRLQPVLGLLEALNEQVDISL